MKRCFCGLLVLILVICLSLGTWADRFPWFEAEGDYTYLRTFYIKEAPADQLAFWKEWKESSRNIMFMGAAGFYTCVIVPEGARTTLSANHTNSGNWLSFTCDKPMQYLFFIDEEGDNHKIMPLTFGIVAPNTEIPAIRYIVTDTFWPKEHSFPNLGWNYFIEYDGHLVIVDDLGEDGGEDAGFLSWLKKIWDWLTSFWDKLKELLLGLFVPRDGFFGDWFEEIRSAFDTKLGGLGKVFDRIKELLSNPGQAGDIKIPLPAQFLNSGSQVAEISLIETLRPLLNFIRPILTGLIVVLTIIKCYKRVIALANT